MTLATIENMDSFAHVPNLIAWSPSTGEEYSANSGDYWHVGPYFTLTDSDDNAMLLVVKQCTMVDVAEITS